MPIWEVLRDVRISKHAPELLKHIRKMETDSERLEARADELERVQRSAGEQLRLLKISAAKIRRGISVEWDGTAEQGCEEGEREDR